ncbi:MAG TPA: hypothetical protein VF520_15715 [Thermoleophilaceae bacterium]|jgi:hypothetical protein
MRGRLWRGSRLGAATALAAVAALAPAGPARALPGSFDQVGHNALESRGVNAGLAVHGRYAYVGSRTDGSHPNAGIYVVDVGDPADPTVVHQVGPPDEGNLGESSRELRVWPQAGLLIVLNFGCDTVGHACAGAASEPPAPSVRFYDIRGENAARPKLVATYSPPRLPHEMFLWVDPRRPRRALLYVTTPYLGEGTQQLIVLDVSRAREGRFRELGSWTAGIHDPEATPDLHSLGLSDDGRRAYLAYLGGGFLVADTSDFALGRRSPRVRLVTPIANRVHWGDPGTHSAVKLFGRPYALTTDEVYGRAFGLAPVLGFNVLKGCPWGWSRIVDVRDPTRPRIVAEHRLLPYNDPAYCESVFPLRNESASFSSHNPTLTRDLALVTWHSGGLQAISIRDPRHPAKVAEFLPEPLPAVATEDPALSSGLDKVVMWSYPIVKDGLVYVVDLRNGLYVLRYRGPHEREIACMRFVEGNSNVGGGIRRQVPRANCRRR